MKAPANPWLARATISMSRSGARPPAERGEREQQQRDDEHAALAEVVGGAAAEQQEAREGDRVRVDDPLQLGRGEVEAVWIDGSATLTMLRSRMTMNCATQQTASSHAERARPAQPREDAVRRLGSCARVHLHASPLARRSCDTQRPPVSHRPAHTLQPALAVRVYHGRAQASSDRW